MVQGSKGQTTMEIPSGGVLQASRVKSTSRAPQARFSDLVLLVLYKRSAFVFSAFYLAQVPRGPQAADWSALCILGTRKKYYKDIYHTSNHIKLSKDIHPHNQVFKKSTLNCVLHIL